MWRFDQIGVWSEVKLEILKQYAAAYSTILNAQRAPVLHHVYVDAFAGAGLNISKSSGEFIPGSPVNALSVRPPFREYHFIDLDRTKAGTLRDLAAARKDVHVHEGDCNEILLERIFPQIKFEDYRRGLCVLDPYGLHLDWEVIRTADTMGSIDTFLNFPVMDINRNVLWRKPEAAGKADIARMNRFWGDDSWRTIAYPSVPGLFGPMHEKASNDVIAEAFRARLMTTAGFKRVTKPLPMRNSRGAVVYYLFFASQKPVANNIVADIFRKYRRHGER